LAAYDYLALFLVSAFLCSVKVFRFLEEVWIGKLKKQVTIKLKERKELEKYSYALFALDFFVVLGENI
jgi:hypothetical protein